MTTTPEQLAANVACARKMISAFRLLERTYKHCHDYESIVSVVRNQANLALHYLALVGELEEATDAGTQAAEQPGTVVRPRTKIVRRSVTPPETRRKD